MKIDIQIDLGWSAGQKRIVRGSVVAAVVVAVLGVGVAVAAPSTFTGGEVLSATKLNQSFTDLDTRTTAVTTKVTSLETDATSLKTDVAALNARVDLKVSYKGGNNGSISCDANCESTTFGPSGTCVAAQRVDTGAYFACGSVPGVGVGGVFCWCARP